MSFVSLYFIVLPILIVLDALWLSLLHKPFYIKHLGHLMAESVVWWSVGAFYLLYSLGILLLVIKPAVDLGFTPGQVALSGSFLGLIAYGTYELTNKATLKDWSFKVVIIDMLWGAFMTGFVCLSTFLIYSYLN